MLQVVLAHPAVVPAGLALPPVLVAMVAVGLVWGTGRLTRARGGGASDGLPEPEELSGLRLLTRGLGVALLALAIAAGRLGDPSELDNIAPALVIGIGWPLLIMASAVLGDAWAWLNPWDTLARLLEPVAGDAPGDVREGDDQPDVRWAAPAALAWVWYLHVYQTPLAPRAVGAALAAYTLLTLAGCLAFGRRRWLASAEVFTVFLGWVAHVRRGRLVTWDPPRGADLVLGVLGGGLLFGVLRFSHAWEPAAASTRESLWAPLCLLALCAAGAVLLRVLDRYAARIGAPGAVLAAAVPAVAAVAVAVSLARSRLATSLQLLPALAGDPLGRGWDPFGLAAVVVNPNPLGNTGLALAQVLVLCAGGIAGAVIARRRAGSGPALSAVSVLVAAGVLSTTAV